MNEHKDPYLQTTLNNLVHKKFSNLIESKNLREWKETLAYCVTYSEDCGKKLALELGNNLLQMNQIDSAIICFIVANAFGATLELWDKKLRAALKQAPYKERSMLIHKTFEKVFILKALTRNQDSHIALDTLLM